MAKTRKFGEKVMVVWEMTVQSVLSLIRVPLKVKVNADYYIEHVLKPLLESEVIKFYGEEACKVLAPRHSTCPHRQQYQSLCTRTEDEIGYTYHRQRAHTCQSTRHQPIRFLRIWIFEAQAVKVQSKNHGWSLESTTIGVEQ